MILVPYYIFFDNQYDGHQFFRIPIEGGRIIPLGFQRFLWYKVVKKLLIHRFPRLKCKVNGIEKCFTKSCFFKLTSNIVLLKYVTDENSSNIYFELSTSYVKVDIANRRIVMIFIFPKNELYYFYHYNILLKHSFLNHPNSVSGHLVPEYCFISFLGAPWITE
jgi:hypothetical protein